MKTTTLYLRDILFETECPVCRRETEYTTVCGTCTASLEALRLEPPVFSLEAGMHGAIMCAAAFAYAKETVPFLFYLKQNDVNAAFRIAAGYCVGVLTRLPVSDGTVFVHVPRRRENIRRFGFDHAALLAKACAKMTPFASAYVPLIKRRFVKSAEQKTLDRMRRAENVSGIFYIDKRTICRAAGASAFVIVDDVITSGSSVKACVRALKEVFPSTPVYALAIANASVKEN